EMLLEDHGLGAELHVLRPDTELREARSGRLIQWCMPGLVFDWPQRTGFGFLHSVEYGDHTQRLGRHGDRTHLAQVAVMHDRTLRSALFLHAPLQHLSTGHVLPAFYHPVIEVARAVDDLRQE